MCFFFSFNSFSCFVLFIYLFWIFIWTVGSIWMPMPVTPIDVECQLFSGWRAAHICRLRRWHRPMLQSIYVAICHDSTEDALPRRRRRQRIVYQSHGLASGQCQIPRHGGAHLWRDEPQGGLRLQRSKSLFVGHQRHPQGIFFSFLFLFSFLFIF